MLQSAPLIFQEPCEQLACTCGAATERPVVKAYLPPRPSPAFPVVDTCCLLRFVSHRRYWDQEVLRAEKDAREPSLTKAIIKCYWKSYLPFAIFKLFEVKAFIYSALLYTCRSVLRWMQLVGKEARGLISEDKMSRKHNVAQWLYLSLEYKDT